MYLTDIAGIVFVCVTVNHLGLIGAVEQTIAHEIPVVNCPKCLSFWTTMLYCILQTDAHTVQVLAVSLASGYAAVWLELAEGYVDKLYNIAYDKIYPTESAADAETLCPDSGMPAMRTAARRSTGPAGGSTESKQRTVDPNAGSDPGKRQKSKGVTE